MLIYYTYINMFILYIYQYIINILYIHQCIIHILSQSVSGEDRDAHREAPRLLYMQMTAPFNTAGAATPCARRRRDPPGRGRPADVFDSKGRTSWDRLAGIGAMRRAAVPGIRRAGPGRPSDGPTHGRLRQAEPAGPGRPAYS